MMRTRYGALAFALSLGCAAAPLAAQSLFATRGLGVPVPPVDARASALGGIGVGLIGFHTSLTNPAELAGITRRGVSAALQPVSTSVELEGVEDGTSGTRFPLMSILYPISPRIVASVGFGSYLDQSWGVRTDTTVVIGDDLVAVSDLLRSSGGIAQLRLSVSYALTPTLAVGAAGGLLTGNVQRSAIRTFSDSASVLQPFAEEVRWRYSAPMAVLGVRWDIAGRVRVGASALLAADVDAETDDDAEDRSHGAPLQLSAGASTRLGNLLLATAGVVWDRFPTVAEPTLSSETMRLGGGLEYQGVRSGQRAYPVRLGFRWAQLPYYLDGEEQPTEWAAGIGLGFRLGDPRDPAAVADFGVERGARSGLAGGVVSGIDEQLWRFTFSLSLFAR